MPVEKFTNKIFLNRCFLLSIVLFCFLFFSNEAKAYYNGEILVGDSWMWACSCNGNEQEAEYKYIGDTLANNNLLGDANYYVNYRDSQGNFAIGQLTETNGDVEWLGHFGLESIHDIGPNLDIAHHQNVANVNGIQFWNGYIYHIPIWKYCICDNGVRDNLCAGTPYNDNCGNWDCYGSRYCPPAPFCGDGSCNNGETCSTCPADCGACPPPATCPNGICNVGENCNNCPSDCGICPPSCGDGTCNSGETCSTCPSDCGVCPSSSGGGSVFWKEIAP